MYSASDGLYSWHNSFAFNWPEDESSFSLELPDPLGELLPLVASDPSVIPFPFELLSVPLGLLLSLSVIELPLLASPEFMFQSQGLLMVHSPRGLEHTVPFAQSLRNANVSLKHSRYNVEFALRQT